MNSILTRKMLSFRERENRAIANQHVKGTVNQITKNNAIQLATDEDSFIDEQESLQGKFIIQRKPGEYEELPLQRLSLNAANNKSLQAFQPSVQRKENNTGMPDNLKIGLENISGFNLSDVKVHYNSPKPAQLRALAYAQGNDIHIGPGQEKHLSHEGWHIVQQKQGRVTPTVQMKGGVAVNDDPDLEHEADIMGAKALQMFRPMMPLTAFNPLASTTQLKCAACEQEEKTVQRKKEKTAAKKKKVTASVDEDDKKEFKLIKGVVADRTVEEYLIHRKNFFGPKGYYLLYASISDDEFDNDKDLQRVFDYKEEKGRIIYRWTRRAYENDGVEHVPELIKHGESKEFKTALGKVKKGFGKNFKHGGFNPRPMKNSKYQLRLGTVSNHGFGNAVDVEDAKNPILSKANWLLIESIAGKSVDRSLSRWHKNPEAFWTDINELNSLFVKNIKEKIEKLKEEQIAKDKAAKDKKTVPAKSVDPLNMVVPDKNKDLRKFIDGFFSLEWELVKQLHDNGFTWGATFGAGKKGGDIDLHHFELPLEPKKEKPKGDYPINDGNDAMPLETAEHIA